MTRQGPLTDLRVVEIAGLGPTPFAAMWLADMGAEVVRIERPGLKPLIPQKVDVLNRGRGFVALDLKSTKDQARARALIERADLLIEGMRPGVMERLGLGPEVFEASNPKLVYGRMTGWGQTGPLAHSAGHDINYIALSGALHAIGGDAPVPPLNLVGDFGGGAMYLVAGLLAALHETGRTGKGQVVDCAITDGAAHLMAMVYSMNGSGLWADRREANLLDGGAPFYRCYECACGGHMAVGALEAKFYAELLRLLALERTQLPAQMDVSGWPRLRDVFASRFLERSRDDWAEIFEGTDACTVPVLTLAEAPAHPHNAARGAFVDLAEVAQPRPAPVLSRTPGMARTGVEREPASYDALLDRWSKPA
ncbi:CaiB/BaiF CoA-transferase family protein [Aliiroseovarius sp.]|uniref:CaiB/BaiF CoA transferase family protein n=1 Tax=Aliiroseovarius sp. TaxID=1872442 RepID=UPI00262C4540|nr:CaiB/BaiF CoA-transferase family protein [Aliiroseovarius sp.]